MGIDGMNSADIFDEYFDDEKKSEIEKMYRNAGVKFIIGVHCRAKIGDGCKSRCPDCDYNTKPKEYPPFTAEKQLELIKWLAKHYGNIHILNNAARGFAIGIEGVSFNLKKFEEIIAMVLNTFWQDLTEQERTEVAEILRG